MGGLERKSRSKSRKVRLKRNKGRQKKGRQVKNDDVKQCGKEANGGKEYELSCIGRRGSDVRQCSFKSSNNPYRNYECKKRAGREGKVSKGNINCALVPSHLRRGWRKKKTTGGRYILKQDAIQSLLISVQGERDCYVGLFLSLYLRRGEGNLYHKRTFRC